MQEKIKKVRLELAPDFELLEEPTSPRSLKEFHQKKEVIVLATARSPRKGRISLHPQDSLAELLGARDAA